MKIFISFFAVLLLALSVSAQTNGNSQTPKELYSKDSKRLIKISDLIGTLDNGEKKFEGKISRLQWNKTANSVYFDIGKQTFDLDYSNVSNAGRSHLKDILKKNNRVRVDVYAGGSNGVWLVREISQK